MIPFVSRKDTSGNSEHRHHLKKDPSGVLYQEKKNYIGGAGIVARHLESAGAKVSFTTVLGNDKLKEFVLRELKDSKIKLNAIIDKTRPTTNKNTIVANGYKLLKIDKIQAGIDFSPVHGV